ncbi:Casein kinase I family protein-like 1 [Heracleum sosnowskyi]|uniref:histidine kinase n=1 Tax=Heracleum sosnowskyi TaxID=360622 RepID=A0AAD8MFR9_9APIA|nr:Casein kinase I family protein-like 1 [Heracleum sosnowskyi]
MLLCAEPNIGLRTSKRKQLQDPFGKSKRKILLQCSMLLTDMVVLRTIVFFLVLAGGVLVPPSLVFNYWHTRSRTIEEDVRLFTQKLHQEILSGVEVKADLLSPLHSSATNLVRMLSSSVNESQLSIFNIESEVAPLLFQAFSTIPYVSQVSYIRKDGLFFSYYNQVNQQPVAVYTNTSLFPVDKELAIANYNFTCYSQPVNRDTGKLYGVVTSHPLSTLLVPSILQAALGSANGNTSVGPSWIDSQDLLFLNTAVMDGRGAISLGFETKGIVQSLSGSISNDGSLFLATKDGQVLNEAKIQNTRIVINSNSSSVAFELSNRSGDKVASNIVGNLTCQENDGTLRPKTITISGTKYDVYCSQVEILGVEAVFVLVMPLEGPERSLHKHFSKSYQYLFGTIGLIFFLTVVFVCLLVGALQRVIQLRAALMKQMDATAQAERKGIKKSTNYANASHDVRASLAGITGLIEICLTQVDRGSDLEGNIKHMKSCSQDLLGILNNILDRSKLEAGKVTLDQEEFEVSKLVEDVADLFHAAGIKKGIDVVLDISDGSINKFDRVKGDRKKLRQILSNIVSNAVKFTSEGSVSIRVYARKPRCSSLRLNSTRKGPLSWFLCFQLQKNEAFTEYGTTVNSIQKGQNCMEFVFEVDDTGVGIPKDKQETVFENYAQIKETSAGQEGTGLGLGIVQSLVRLMGGEIEIVDKEVGKKGTCFKFNTYLHVCEIDQRTSSARSQYDDIESNVGGYMSSCESHSARNMQFINPNTEGSQVVLFIKNEERRKVCKKFFERQGIKVLVPRNYEELSTTLKKIRHRRVLSLSRSSKRSDALLQGMIVVPRNLSTRSKEVPLSSLDGTEQEMPPTHRRSTTRGSVVPSFILIVIDTDGGPFRELSRVVAEFRRNISTGFNSVVWLDRPGSGYIQLQGLNEDKLPPSDIIISQPFHGSRLYQVLKLLPEFGGEMPEATPPSINSEKLTIISATNSAANEASTSVSQPRPAGSSSFPINLQSQIGEIKEADKPLSGKKVLLVEDEALLQKIATAVLSKLGANTEICVNGQEAVQTVSKALNDQRASHVLPFDCIFMDCEMPVMNGIEATRRIREEEAKFKVHIPIFAVSAHTDGPEIRLMKEAGVDYNLSKPLTAAKIEEAFKLFHARQLRKLYEACFSLEILKGNT